MLVEVKFLKKYSETDCVWCKEVYDVSNEWKALDNVYDRHGRFKIIEFKTKVLDGSNARASSTYDGVQSQGAIFGDSSEA